MKLLVLGGSPNRNGSPQILIDSFGRGAEDAGHSVTVMNAAHMNVQPCTGCIACGYDGPCIQKDDMSQIRNAVMERLTEFKAAYGESITAINRCLRQYVPGLGEERRQTFLYTPFSPSSTVFTPILL